MKASEVRQVNVKQDCRKIFRQSSTSRSSQRMMEKFLKGKTLYIENSEDRRTVRFVISNVTRRENGVLVESENGRIFICHQCLKDLKKQGWHRQHLCYGRSLSMIEISIDN